MPKQEDTINLFDPDTGSTMSISTSLLKEQIELKTIVGEVPTGSALKFDSGKLPLHLLSTEAMNQTAAVLAFGADKYAEHNWRKGFVWSRPLSAACVILQRSTLVKTKTPSLDYRTWLTQLVALCSCSNLRRLIKS